MRLTYGRSRQIASLVLLSALGCAAAVDQSAARSARPRAVRQPHRRPVRRASACPPAHTRLYALSPDGAIFSHQTGAYGDSGPVSGCLSGTSRSFAVGHYLISSQLQADVSWAALRRPYAMATQTETGPQILVNPSIAVYDLRSGHRVRLAQPLYASTCFSCRLFSVKLGRSADLVWTQSNEDGSVSLVRADATGMTTLDRGSVDPQSLALSDSGATVYWLDAGAAHAATLP